MKIPYPMRAAVSSFQRHQHMLAALATKRPRVQQVPIDEARAFHVAAYGPSLRDTWRDLGRPILSMSGATRWLAERGVVPDYHVELDPRGHKLACIDPPVPGVHYLMATICAPRAWEKATAVRAARAEIVRLGPGAEAGRVASPLEGLIAYPPPEWTAGLAALAEAAETRRALARYDTGTVSVATMLVLRAVVEVVRPAVVIEIGTFIGSSALAMQAGLHGRGGHLYTCDKDNDCLPPDGGRTCYPYTRSTDMLADLAAKGVRADLFFFDGRVQLPDVPLILRCSRARTVYAFDDCTGREKGIMNVERLRPVLPRHRFVPPGPPMAAGVTVGLLLPPEGAR